VVSILQQDSLRPKLPDFVCYNIPKHGKMYHMNTKYNKWPCNLPSVRKIYQMAVKYTNKPTFLLQGHPKSTQNGIFGMQKYHLATLLQK
jgi:hypothetical protein